MFNLFILDTSTPWPTTLAATGAMLVSAWKPVLLLVPIVAWAWLIAAVFDKHAAKFHLGREKWNAIHLSVGLVAVLLALLLPLPSVAAFWAALALILVVLAADIVAFAQITNNDDRVPDRFRLHLNMDSLRAARAAKTEAKQQGRARLRIDGPNGRLDVPLADAPEFQVRVAAEDVYFDARGARASQHDIVPGPQEGMYTFSNLIDGVRQGSKTMPAADAIKIIDLWKAAAGLDVEDRRRRLVGEVEVVEGDDKHVIKITSSGSKNGLRLTMLFDPNEAVNLKPSKLGMLDRQFATAKQIVDDRQGIVLLATPAHAGRTTLMYSILKMHDAYTQNVQTVETEMQGAIEGVRQNVFNPMAEDGPNYASYVRSLLRRDPDVLAIADLPDAATAQEAAKVEPDRARVYVCIRADNALQAVQVWCKAVGELDMASQSLHGVIAQKLVRCLCTNCRVPYQPSKEMLAKLGLPADKVQQLFKKGGQVMLKGNKPEICPACNGIGYVGQTGIFEVYPIGDQERAAVRAGDLTALRSELAKKQLPTMHQTSLRKAVEGVTSIEEIARISGDKPAKPAPKQEAASTA